MANIVLSIRIIVVYTTPQSVAPAKRYSQKKSAERRFWCTTFLGLFCTLAWHQAQYPKCHKFEYESPNDMKFSPHKPLNVVKCMS